MNVLELLKNRYAVKIFTGEKISEEDVNKMKEAIRLTPSSFNWQPWKVKIISDEKVLKELQASSYNQPQVGTASHLFVFCSIGKLEENNKKLVEYMKKNLPAHKYEVFEAMSNGAISNLGPKEKRGTSEREIFAAMQSLLLMVEDLGYGSCPIGGFDRKKYKEILKLDEDLEPVIIVPVGIGADEPRKKYRFSQKEIFLD